MYTVQGGNNKSHTGCLIEQTVQYSLLFVISLTLIYPSKFRPVPVAL